MSDQKLLAIDADYMCYVASVAPTSGSPWSRGKNSSPPSVKAQQGRFKRDVAKLEQRFPNHLPILCYNDLEGRSFRKDLSTDYKGARKGDEKPKGYYELREWSMDNWTWRSMPFLEGDDVVGLIGSKHPDRCIMVSEDKDLKTIPGTLYQKKELTTFSEEEADYNWYMQTLTGDSTDGYTGIPGIGPKKAEKLLGLEPDWQTVVRAYALNQLTEEDALLQARLARILRWTDWDVENDTHILWTPP